MLFKKKTTHSVIKGDLKKHSSIFQKTFERKIIKNKKCWKSDFREFKVLEIIYYIYLYLFIYFYYEHFYYELNHAYPPLTLTK